MMAIPLHVLILEDLPADAALMVAELRHAGYEPEWRRVSTEAAYRAALKPAPDLILADHALPSYDSARALKQMQAGDVEIPFVIVSGMIGEETAVALIKAGASDYVAKNHLGGLGPAVTRALEDPRVRRGHGGETSVVLHRVIGLCLLLALGLDTVTPCGYSDWFLYVIPIILSYWSAHLELPILVAGISTLFLVLGFLVSRPPPHPSIEFFDGVNRLGWTLVLWLFTVVASKMRRRETRSEQRSRTGERQLHRITSNMLDLVSEIDGAGIVRYVTPSSRKVLGHPPEALIGRTLAEFVHPEERGRWLTDLRQVLDRRKPSLAEFRCRHADGHHVWLEASANVVQGDDGGAPSVILAARDVTGRRQAQEQLQLKGAAVEAAANSIVLTDRAGAITWVNRSFTDLTGYAPEEVLGRNLRLLKSGAQDRSFYEVLWKTILSGEPWKGELVNRRKDGSTYPEEMTITPVSVGRSGITHFIAIKQDVTERNRDISERKRAEEALRASEERFRNAFEYAGVGIAVLDLEGRFLRVNPAYLQLLGYSESELTSTTFQTLTPPDDLPAELEKLSELLAGTRAGYQIEKRNIGKAGDIVWVLKTVTLVRDAAGRPLQMLAQVQDITARRQSESRFRQLNLELEGRVRERTSELEATNKELESFAYSVSHDLRAPLRAIDGFSQALLEDYTDRLDAHARDSLTRVRAAAQRMARLIDDLLQLSQMTRVSMTRETVDLTAMAARIAAELQAAEPGRRVEFRTADGLTAQGDSQLLEVCLRNLLSNAWKFTSKTPHARVDFAATDLHGRRAFFVRDNGAGFDMAFVDRLFGAFQRLHSAEEFPGTGIGLATVQRIIRRHGGEVRAEGAVGSGATITFTLGP